MIRKQASFIVKLFIIVMMLVFLATYVEASSYAKSGANNATMNLLLLAGNAGSLILGVVGIIMLLLIGRGRFSFDDDNNASLSNQKQYTKQPQKQVPVNQPKQIIKKPVQKQQYKQEEEEQDEGEEENQDNGDDGFEIMGGLD